MVNQTLVDYVRAQLQKGVSENKLRGILANSNWPDSEIDEAFDLVGAERSVPVKREEMPLEEKPQEKIITKKPSSKKKILYIVGGIIGFIIIMSILSSCPSNETGTGEQSKGSTQKTEEPSLKEETPETSGEQIVCHPEESSEEMINLPVSISMSNLNKIMSGLYNQYQSALDTSLISYEFTNEGGDPVSLTIISEIQDYTSQAKDTVMVPPHDKKALKQHPLLKPNIQVNELITANLHYKIYVTDDETKVYEKTEPVKLYAKDTMIWGMFDNLCNFIDTSNFIGAWVTPNVKEIDELLRIAAEHHPNKQIEGYQCSDCKTDEEYATYAAQQVKSIYDALKEDYKITYINAPISFTAKTEASQKVKLPADAINLASANCIDGSVLFASAIEKIGMNAYIMIIPGHAFVCWDIKEGSNTVNCLETTMINSATFEEAEEQAVAEYNEEVTSGNIDSGASKLLSVKKIREAGIMPMS